MSWPQITLLVLHISALIGSYRNETKYSMNITIISIFILQAILYWGGWYE